MCCLILTAILGVTASSQAMTVWSLPLAEDKPRRACTNLCCSNEEAPFPPHPHITVSTSNCAFDEALFLQVLCDEDSEDDYTEADPVLDDLFFRRVKQTLHQTSTSPHHDRFLPRYWSPEEECRVRTIYLGSRRRPWYRKMQNLRSVGFFLLHYYAKQWGSKCDSFWDLLYLLLKLIQSKADTAVIFS